MRHKHADAIIAWANGEEIQVDYEDGWGWQDVDEWPSFDSLHKYRIKPQEDTWTPCKSGKLRLVEREGRLGMTYRQLQQFMVNQKAEYKWMDVPVEEEDNG